jgi:cytoskeleton protein RodZ
VQEENQNEEYENATMGEILRQAREKQKKTLRHVADELCIRRSYLEAIENMDFENIPPAPYGTGFIRSYAQYLGLNSERILLSYRKSIGAVENDEPYSNAEPPAAPKIHHIVIGVLGLAAIGAVWAWQATQTSEPVLEPENFESEVLVPEPEIIDTPEQQNVTFTEPKEEEHTQEPESENSQKENEAPQKEVTETAVLPQVESSAKAEPQTQKPQEPTPEPAAKISKMQMKLVGPTWVELRQDGRILISNVYKKGFTYDIPSEGNITVSVGRYYNVEFWRDGQKIKVVTAMRKKNVSLNPFMQSSEKKN